MIQGFQEFIQAIPLNMKPEDTLRMSVAGDCARKLEYQKILGTAPITFDQWMRMESGQWLGKMMAHWFDQAFPGNFINPEMEVELTTPGGNKIVGHIDGELQSLDMVVDFKWISSSSYQMVSDQNKPFDTNLDQITLYTTARGRSKSCLLYINRENPGQMLPIIFERDDERAKQILTRIDSVIENRKNGVISERPYTDKSGSPCWYCPYKEKCYEGFAGEVSTYKVTELVHDESFRLARASVIARTGRLMNEKAEEDLRQKLGTLLHGMGIKQAVVKGERESFSVSLTVGKKDNLITTVRESK